MVRRGHWTARVERVAGRGWCPATRTLSGAWRTAVPHRTSARPLSARSCTTFTAVPTAMKSLSRAAKAGRRRGRSLPCARPRPTPGRRKPAVPGGTSCSPRPGRGVPSGAPGRPPSDEGQLLGGRRGPGPTCLGRVPLHAELRRQYGALATARRRPRRPDRPPAPAEGEQHLTAACRAHRGPALPGTSPWRTPRRSGAQGRALSPGSARAQHHPHLHIWRVCNYCERR